MINAVEYLKDKTRMTNACRIDCDSCPLSIKNNGTDEGCVEFEMKYPEEAVQKVEEWSKSHPILTNADKFKEVFGFGGHTQIDQFAQWWDIPYEAPKGAEHD